MKKQEVRAMFAKLGKAQLFILPEEDELIWNAGPVSDRIKMRWIDSMEEQDGVIVLKSLNGTEFDDHIVYFSIRTGAVSNDNITWYAAGGKIQLSTK